jgi:hypothetical protein
MEEKWIKSNKLVGNKYIGNGVRHALIPIKCFRKNAIFQDLSTKAPAFNSFATLFLFYRRAERKGITSA